MKRRLDLALALVHRPRMLFLDEPTTGLDPQSRSELWEEVARLAREDGVTVFLTTQYLEEADVLADRIGIIDHGRIVATGTPDALKAEIGRPSLELVPAEPAIARGSPTCSRASARRPRAARGGRRPAATAAPRSSRDVVRALDAEGLPVSRLPAARADARRRVPLQDRPQARRGRRGARGVTETPLHIQVGELARRSVVQTLRQPLLIVPPVLFPLVLVAMNSSGLQAATHIPGFPTDNYVDFAIAFAFIQGVAVRDDQRRDRARARRGDRLPEAPGLTPMQRPALLIGQLSGVILVAFVSALIYLAVGFAAGLHVKAGPRRRHGAAGRWRC